MQEQKPRLQNTAGLRTDELPQPQERALIRPVSRDDKDIQVLSRLHSRVLQLLRIHCPF